MDIRASPLFPPLSPSPLFWRAKHVNAKGARKMFDYIISRSANMLICSGIQNSIFDDIEEILLIFYKKTKNKGTYPMLLLCHCLQLRPIQIKMQFEKYNMDSVTWIVLNVHTWILFVCFLIAFSLLNGRINFAFHFFFLRNESAAMLWHTNCPSIQQTQKHCPLFEDLGPSV